MVCPIHQFAIRKSTMRIIAKQNFIMDPIHQSNSCGLIELIPKLRYEYQLGAERIQQYLQRFLDDQFSELGANSNPKWYGLSR